MIYENLIEYIPTVLQGSANIKAILDAIASELKDFDTSLDTINKMWLASDATGEYLDVVGQNIQVYRNGRTDSVYRKDIKRALYNLFFVPTINNFIFYISEALGFEIDRIEEGWNMPFLRESAYMEVDVLFPASENIDAISDFDKIYSAGVKINWRAIPVTQRPIRFLGLDHRCGLPKLFQKTVEEKIGLGYGEVLKYPCGFDYKCGIKNISNFKRRI